VAFASAILLLSSPPSGALAAARDDPPEVAEILDLARVAPPEFRADALLVLVEADKVPGRARKLELIEEALAMASAAKFSRKMRLAVGHFDTPEGFLSHAHALNLDRESLGYRVVRALARLEPRRARELFEAIADFRVPPHSCESALTYAPEAAFETLEALLIDGFDAEERASGKQWNFAERYLAAISSPVQVIPAMRFLAKLEAPEKYFMRLLGAFTGALVRMPADDRAFSNSYTEAMLIEEAESLAEHLPKQGLSAASLPPAIRHYIVANLSGVRCADNVRRAERAKSRHGAEEVVRKFNASRLRRSPYVEREVLPITHKEAQPEKIGGAPPQQDYWSSPERAELLEALKSLRFGPAPGPGQPQRPRSLEERSRSEGRAQLLEVIKRLENLKPEKDEDEISFFRHRSVPYTSLLELAPEGLLRETVLPAAVACLVQSPLQQRSPVLWFVSANFIADRMRRSQLTAAGSEGAPERDVRWALREFERSGSVILALAAKLDALRPHPPQ
jgi:hypothetical protein